MKKKNDKKGLKEKKKNDKERLEEKERQERLKEQQRLDHELEMKKLELGVSGGSSHSVSGSSSTV